MSSTKDEQCAEFNDCDASAPMKAQTELRDLDGYAPLEPAQYRGPFVICKVQSLETGDTHWLEAIDQGSSSAELFAHVRRQWQQNARYPLAGSLTQRDLVDSGNRLSRVIDLPSGLPISETLFRDRFEVSAAIATAISLTECLAQWHESNRVHGGLSGDCIFRDADNGIQLREIEFFEGQFKQDLSAVPPDAVIFYSPESSGSLAREISPASDLYSVGVLLFCMLSGRSPVKAINASEYLNRQLCADAPRLRELGLDVPPALDEIVARLLRRDPRDRYESARGLLFDLVQVQQHCDRSSKLKSFAIGTQDLRTTLTEPSLVGREDEIDQIKQTLTDVRTGQPKVQLVTGADARYRQNLLDEIGLQASAKSMYVLRGGASSGNPRPLQSLQSVLTTIARQCIDDIGLAKRLSEATKEHGNVLSELLPVLSGLWSTTDHPVGPDAYGSQRVAIALEELFAAFARERHGVLFLFDDLDIADDLTQTVVRSLVERMKRQQRSGEQQGSLFLHVAVSGESVQRCDYCVNELHIALGALSNTALAAHLKSSAGKLDDVITASIVDVAAGDPTMATTILARMIDAGVVVASNEGWQATGPLSESLRRDESIAESLELQISKLTPRARQILMAAAVIGQHFRLKTLAHLTGLSYAELLDVCSDALRRRLLWRDPQLGGFRFAHNHVHELLRLGLDEAQQQRYHLETAAYFEVNEPSNVFELAVHYDAAGDRDRALHNALAAAQIARQKYSLSVARDHLLIAKRWLQDDDRATGLRIWEGLGEVELLTGGYDEAATSLRKALELAQSGLERARIQQRIGELAFKRGRFVTAATEYEQALAMTGVRVPGNVVTMLLGLAYQALCQVIHSIVPANWIARNETPSDLDCLRLQTLSRLSHVYWFSRHKLWTLGNHLRSLNMAERFAPSATLAAVYSEHGPVMSLLRWFSRANRYAERSLSIRKELGDVWGQGQSHHYHSVVKLAECKFHDAIRSAMQAVSQLRKMGDLWEMNMASYQAANAHYRIGNYAEATELAMRMFDCGREIDDLQATGISLDVWARTSPHTLPLELVAEEAAKSRPDAQSHAQTQLAYAIILLHLERTDDAIEVLQEAIHRSEAAGHLNTYISPCYAWLGTALRRSVEGTDLRDGRHRQQRITLARKAMRKARRIAKGFPGDLAHCYRELGLLDAIGGNINSAVRNLNKSRQSAAKYHQPKEELETLRCLLFLYKVDAEILGSVSSSLQAQFDQLTESDGDEQIIRHEPETKSSNLSLADRFVTVLQSGRQIAQALSADVVYSEASEAARKLLRGQNVDVVMINAHEGDLKFSPLGECEFDEARRARIQMHEPIIRVAYAEGLAVCDSSTDLPRSRFGSAIAAPIAFRGTNVAVILVTHDELKDLFSIDEQRIADFVSTLAGAALENADGFLRLRQLNDTLEQRVLDRTKAAEERAQQLAVSNQQLRVTEDQLREAIVHANAANEAKGRFLATISHEIRTPLNGILGMTRLAQQAPDDVRRSSCLDTVQESGESLLALINDLLDVSKLESGKLELEHIALQPRAIADEICRLMSASATEKSVDLIWNIEPSVPKTVLGDPSRIRQIVMNLIGNAIKFTEQGSVVLNISFDRTDNSTDWLSIKVKDSGIGIPADKIDTVFESFSQVDSSTTRRYGGTGLGLAICRELSEMMGGSITLESDLGVGSEFTVRLPVEIVETDDADNALDEGGGRIDISPNQSSSFKTTLPSQLHVSTPGSESNQPIRILVAEDGEINQEVIVGMLEMHGYEVVVANNGEEALQKAAEGSYALCLMDVDMPKMDGIEATKQIRATIPGSDRQSLPIIAMTAHCSDLIWSKCEAAGMNAYIPKPIDPKTLFENIDRFAKSLESTGA